MMSITFAEYAVVAVTAVLGTASIIWAARLSDRRNSTTTVLPQQLPGPVFLFENETLVDATPSAHAMLEPHLKRMPPLEAMLHVLSMSFPDIRDKLDGNPSGKVRVAGHQPRHFVELDQSDDHLRISVLDNQPADRVQHDLQTAELSMLRELTGSCPQMIWQEDPTGKLLWANEAYLTMFDKIRNTTDTWPGRPLFPELCETNFTSEMSTRRLAVPLPDKKTEQWFDIASLKRDDHVLHFATDANTIVLAEQAKRKFVQTLSQTFAQLSTGLAIFDKRRQLTVFNPAFLDLTKLPVTFLSGRPTVDTVMDRLREQRMLPEPKNYTTWRDQFTALEAAVKNGTYCENWTLPDGQTYRVTGRPHPDGAIAFLFEDISADVSLTRRFRAEIETGQAVMDTLPEAIAVFSNAGTLVMSNKAYANLWGTVHEGSIEHHQLGSEMQVWQSRCSANAMWDDLRTTVHQPSDRKSWATDAILDDGRHISCNAAPIQGGMTMVKFAFEAPVKPIIQKLTQRDPALMYAKR